MKSLIRKLTAVYGPSGYEEDIRKVIYDEISAVVDECRIDALGNLISVKHATQGAGKRVMLAAHMDEIGIIVTHIDENGFLRFAPIGGVLPMALVGARVTFKNGVEGTFGVEGKPLPAAKPDLDEVFLDVGATSREDVPVAIGDAAAFCHQFSDLGHRLIAHNFDDRIGCAVLIQTLRNLENPKNDVYAVFTVQEEVGIRGATTSTFGIEPEVAIAIDGTATGDTPEAEPLNVKLGDGPAIKVKDRAMLSHPGVKQLLIETAQAHDLPYQLEVMSLGTTDAAAMQISQAGVPAGAVSIPMRYVHTPSQMVDHRDAQHAVELLTAVLSQRIDL